MQQALTSSQPRTNVQQVAQPVYEMTDADRERQKRIAEAWTAYKGELPKPFRPMPDKPDGNVMSNRMQAIVDRGVDFLFGKELEISVEQSAPKESQDLLNTSWGRKEARIPLLQKLAMNGALAGNAFLRIVPNKNGSFRLVVVDPATVFIQTMPQDCETVQLYCIEYCMDQKINGRSQRVFYREEISRVEGGDDDEAAASGYEDTDAFGLDEDDTWLIQHWTKLGDRGPWQSGGEPIAWPYPFAPLFHNQNLTMPNDAWGYPDITPDLIGLNMALNLAQSNISELESLLGGPILYATGMGEQTIDIKRGRIIGLPLAESKIVAVPVASDTANALSFCGNLRSDIDEQSGVPGVATGRIEVMPRGNLSGIAIELLFMPLLKKTERKQCLYGKLIIDVSKALLALAGYSPDIDISLAWQGPIPHDDLQSAQYAILLKQLAISNTTLQRNLGFDPEAEMQLSQTENAQQLASFANGQGVVPPGQTAQPGQSLQAQAPAPGQPPQGGQA